MYNAWAEPKTIIISNKLLNGYWIITFSRWKQAIEFFFTIFFGRNVENAKVEKTWMKNMTKSEVVKSFIVSTVDAEKQIKRYAFGEIPTYFIYRESCARLSSFFGLFQFPISLCIWFIKSGIFADDNMSFFFLSLLWYICFESIGALNR